jgi:hypothetical protein
VPFIFDENFKESYPAFYYPNSFTKEKHEKYTKSVEKHNPKYQIF